VQLVGSLRCSDSDREQVAERLRQAMAEGRLSEDEFEQRLQALVAARTYGELDALLADLPVNHAPGRPQLRLGRLAGAVGAVTLVLAVFGVLALLRARSAVAVLGTGHPRDLNLPGPLAGPHQGLIIAASLGAAVVALLTSAALLWALINARSLRRPRQHSLDVAQLGFVHVSRLDDHQQPADGHT
jgi:hypothetical protein